MTILQTMWGKHKIYLSWTPADTLPENLSVTSTHAFCFHEGKIVMVNLKKRGWDIPGGHVEAGETPEECLHREIEEEANMQGRAKMIGYLLVDNRHDEFWDATKYPAIGTQLFYRVDVDNVDAFNGAFESSERRYFDLDEVSLNHGGWNSIWNEIFREAVTAGPVSADKATIGE